MIPDGDGGSPLRGGAVDNGNGGVITGIVVDTNGHDASTPQQNSHRAGARDDSCGYSTNHYQSQGFDEPGAADRSFTQEYGNQRRLLHHRNHGTDQFSWFALKLTVTSALGGFLFGYDTGVVSGALLLIKDDFNLTDYEESVVVSITIAAAVAASLAGGPAMEHWGRRPVILTAAIIFTVGAVLLAAASSYFVLVFGRLVVGLGIGLASLSTPVYIAEAAPSHLRGSLVTLNTLFITCGQVVAGVVDGLFSSTQGGWRYMLGLSGLPSLLMTVGFLSLPESPRWLVAHGRRRQALSVLQTIRGATDVHAELEEMVDSTTDHSIPTVGVVAGSDGRLRETTTVSDLLDDPRIKRALVLGCGLQMLQQLTGINTVMYYSALIFNMAGFTSTSSIWLAALTAASQSVGVCFGLYLIEICGRRLLVLSSLSVVIVSLACLGTGFHLCDTSDNDGVGPSPDRDGSSFGWLVVVAMISYLLAFGVGMSSVPWTMNAEIYPMHARSLGTSAATTTNWVGNVVVSSSFLYLANHALGRAGAFYLYASIGVAGWLWLYGCMPETKGLSLEEIELLFAREGDPLRPGEDGLPFSTNGDSGGERLHGHPGVRLRADGFALLDGNSPDGPGRDLSGRGDGGGHSRSEVPPGKGDADSSWTNPKWGGRNPTLI